MITELEARSILDAPKKTIPVSEIFGPTLEGEGPWAGQPTYFLRVGGCDYACEWCDTDQAVLAENVRKLPRLTVPEIIQRLKDYVDVNPGPELLAISGGNPGLYDLSKVVRWWHETGSSYSFPGTRKVLVETQGSRWQPWFADVDLLTVSPKGPSSGLAPSASAGNLSNFLGQAKHAVDKMILKIVVFNEDDYQFARHLHTSFPRLKLHLSTGTAQGGLTGRWVPPDYSNNPERDRFRTVRDHQNLFWTPNTYADTKESLLDRYRWLAEKAMNDPVMSDVQVQVQLHCLLWGITTKGV